MKRTIWKFGLLTGAIIAGMTAIMLPLCMKGIVDWSHQEIIGWSTMILSFLLVFFGIRSYRDHQGGGSITFGRAFQVGILITLVACAVYVVSWQIVYYGFLPDFGEKFAAYSIEKIRKSGASEAEIAEATASWTRFAELYRNPLINMGMTFLEIFPVGLIVTLVSAAILRRQNASGSPNTVGVIAG
jgi:hypothetical protein